MRFDPTLDENLKKYTQTVTYENQFYFVVDDKKINFTVEFRGMRR